MNSGIWASVAALAVVANDAGAHIFDFVFGMNGNAVVPPTDSDARGMGVMNYNHHTFNYDLDLFITGVALDDLLGTGPNGTPLQIFHAPRGQEGELVLDPGFYGDFVQDGDGIRLTIETIRLGGRQGAFESTIFLNEDYLYEGRLYIELFTVQYPDGEIRGQIPPLPKFLKNEGNPELGELVAPPEPIPAPAAPMLAALAALVASRRRR